MFYPEQQGLGYLFGLFNRVITNYFNITLALRFSGLSLLSVDVLGIPLDEGLAEGYFILYNVPLFELMDKVSIMPLHCPFYYPRVLRHIIQC